MQRVKSRAFYEMAKLIITNSRSENECLGIKRRREKKTRDRSSRANSRRSCFSLIYVSPLVFALIARFLPFLTSGFRSAISQTSCTPLELSEIGPEEERPCPSSKSKRKGKKGRKREETRAERRRKVIFRPQRFQSTSFSSVSLPPLYLAGPPVAPSIFSRENISTVVFLEREACK